MMLDHWSDHVYFIINLKRILSHYIMTNPASDLDLDETIIINIDNNQ